MNISNRVLVFKIFKCPKGLLNTNFTKEQSGTHHLRQMIKLISVTRHTGTVNLQYDAVKGHSVTSAVFLPLKSRLQTNHEKTSAKSSIRSDQISRSVMSDFLRPHELQHARPPCPSPTPGVHSDSHIHRVSDAIQPSHPLSSPSPPAPNPSQHQGLFQ